MLDVNSTAPPVNDVFDHVPSRPKPRKRCRRRISVATWSAIAAAVSRERFFLMVLQPNSPRVRPTLPKLRCLAHPAVIVAATQSAEILTGPEGA